jgi:WD40 repeat protein
VLWCGLFVAVLALAALEGLVLWSRGFRYEHPASLERVWASGISIDANGDWAAASVNFRQKSRKEGTCSDVVLIDLLSDTAVWLGLGRLQPQTVVLTPKADGVAIASMDGSVWTIALREHGGIKAADAPAKKLMGIEGQTVSQLAFSPDGDLLAALGSDTVCVWHWSSGRLLNAFPRSSVAVRAVGFSPDSRYVIFPGASGDVCVWDAKSGLAADEIAMDQSHVSEAARSNQARFLAVAGTVQSPGISVYCVASGRKLWHTNALFSAMALDSRHELVAIRKFESGVWKIDLCDAVTGRRRCTLTGTQTVVAGLSFSADGLLYTWNLDGQVQAWDVDQQRIVWSLSLRQWAADNAPLRVGEGIAVGL